MSIEAEAITTIIRDIRGRASLAVVEPGNRLVDDLGLRSIELIALIARCEQSFGVRLIERRDLLSRVSTVRDMIELIDELRQNRGAA